MLQEKEQHHPSETCKQYRFLLSWPRLVRREYREASLIFSPNPSERTGLFCPTFCFWKKSIRHLHRLKCNSRSNFLCDKRQKIASIFHQLHRVPPHCVSYHQRIQTWKRHLPGSGGHTNVNRIHGTLKYVRIPYNLGVLGLNIWGWRSESPNVFSGSLKLIFDARDCLNSTRHKIFHVYYVWTRWLWNVEWSDCYLQSFYKNQTKHIYGILHWLCNT